MKYSSNNFEISLTVAAADMLRDNGYDIFWHLTGELQENTLGESPSKGVITFVDEVPAVPEYIVRLKSGSDRTALSEYEVAVPALTLQVPSEPVERRRLGLGHSEFEWDVEFRLDGFAEDSFQQMEMAGLFRSWIKRDSTLPIWNYETNPDDPEPLRPAEVRWVSVDRTELMHQVDAIRYYVSLRAGLTFIE